jgi:hypothetical protein
MFAVPGMPSPTRPSSDCEMLSVRRAQTWPDRVFTPDAVKLRQDAVTEDIQKALQRLMPFPALGDVIEIGGRQRRINTVHPHKGGADNRWLAVIILVIFNGFQFTGRKPHSRMRRKAHRVIAGWLVEPISGLPDGVSPAAGRNGKS